MFFSEHSSQKRILSFGALYPHILYVVLVTEQLYVFQQRPDNVPVGRTCSDTYYVVISVPCLQQEQYSVHALDDVAFLGGNVHVGRLFDVVPVSKTSPLSSTTIPSGFAAKNAASSAWSSSAPPAIAFKKASASICILELSLLSISGISFPGMREISSAISHLRDP